MDVPWPFHDTPDTAVITLHRILRGQSPLLLVTHDADDGCWQFLDDEHIFESDAAAVELGTMVQFDSTLLELADLPPGWIARRSAPHEPWARSEQEPVTS